MMAGSHERGGEGEGLHNAARVDDVATIRRLLSADPQSVQKRDRHSRTPYPLGLHLAAWAGQVEAVRVLCEGNADVGATAGDDMAAIHFACQKGHAEVAKILLAAGAQLNLRTRKGMTPLHYAVQGQHEDVAKLLIMRGASLSAQNKAGKRPVDLSKDETFRALFQAAAEEREVLETKRKAQKASQSAANKARFATVSAAEDDEDDKKEDEKPACTIGPSLPPDSTGPASLTSVQEEERQGESVDPDDKTSRLAKRRKLASTVLLAHLVDEENED